MKFIYAKHWKAIVPFSLIRFFSLKRPPLNSVELVEPELSSSTVACVGVIRRTVVGRTFVSDAGLLSVLWRRDLRLSVVFAPGR